MQSRAVIPAFLLYASVALFAAYGARVVAANAERNAIAESRRDVLVVPAPPARRIIDSVVARDSARSAAADSARLANRDGSRRPSPKRASSRPPETRSTAPSDSSAQQTTGR